MMSARNADPRQDGIQIGLTMMLAWLAVYFNANQAALGTDSHLQYMLRMGSAHFWSIVFAVSANVGVFGLIATKPVFRLASVLVVATAHGIFAGCLLMSNASVWSGTYVIIAGMGYYIAYRSTRSV